MLFTGIMSQCIDTVGWVAGWTSCHL